MNRYELLKELYDETSHNLYCYSEDALMTKPKMEYEKQWKEQLEKLELIQEMINEETNNNFHVYTSMYNLRNETDIKYHSDLVCLENRDKGISCYLTADEENGKVDYYLVLSLHKKDEFEDEYENIYTRDIQKDSFTDRETLKNEMQYALDVFEKFIEEDKKSNKFYNKYYEDEEIEEFE